MKCNDLSDIIRSRATRLEMVNCHCQLALVSNYLGDVPLPTGRRRS